MTRVQTIIEEINHLEQGELEIILQEILKRIDRRKQIDSILDEYIGIGEGVWETDAQDYVNELREEE
jgi:ABC-type phosphate transport system auxiliary subunit